MVQDIPAETVLPAVENTNLVNVRPDISGMGLHASPALFSDNAPVMPRIVLSGRY